MATVMDTGSTGLALSSDLIPNDANLKSGPGVSPGFEFLTSSKLLWVGHWVPQTVTFYDKDKNRVATASVPVLAVETAGYCPQYSVATGGGACRCGQNLPPCPCKPGSPECTCPPNGICQLPSASGANIHYLGVGFGREYGGFPYGTPEKNALINISDIHDQPVGNTIHQGYIIHTNGVTVGLTENNTESFGFIKLFPYEQPPFPTSRQDWEEVDMCVELAQPGQVPSKCFPGKALVDTGIGQSYITAPTKFETQGGVLKDGTMVTVNLPGLPGPVAQDSFTVMTPQMAPPWAPSEVIPTDNPNCSSMPVIPPATPIYPPCTFVNTGRNFLFAHQFLYDPGPESGFVGLGPPTPPQPPGQPSECP